MQESEQCLGFTLFLSIKEDTKIIENVCGQTTIKDIKTGVSTREVNKSPANDGITGKFKQFEDNISEFLLCVYKEAYLFSCSARYVAAGSN